MKKLISILLFIVFLKVSLSVSAQTGFQEVKLRSQLFNGAAVGKTVIPAGWQVYVKELTLSSESITWPNAVSVTAMSPDGSVTMKYISRREFQQQFAGMNGFTSQSKDDAYDSGSMRHTLNYRNAGDTCDFMVNIIYPETYNTFLSETPLDPSDIAAVNEYWQLYDNQVRNIYSGAGANYDLKGTEVSIAERTYRSGNNRTVISALVSGHELVVRTDANSYNDYINWNMECIYAMQAPAAVFEQYRDIFNVFMMNTYTSQEYAAMTDRHSIELYNYWMSLQIGNTIPESQLETALNDAADQSIGTGDTYSATDGWMDVINERNDYTTSDGSHIKLPTAFDHVYEGADGTIYAGFGSYYPEGTTELFPTSVGSY